MPHILRCLCLAVILSAGCAPDPNGPGPTATRFWEALRSEEFEAARALTDGASLSEVRDLAAAHPFERVEIGEALDNEAAAQVPTHMVRTTGAGPAFDFQTHLVRVDDGWRVDLRETRRDVTRELLASSFEGVREALRESGSAFVEEFEERALEASEALRETLEELENSLTEPVPPNEVEPRSERGHPTPPETRGL
jgi:hypothetical protein